MQTLNSGIPIRQLSIIGTHNSMSTGVWGDAFQTQSNSLFNQMKMGIRALDIRCRHINNGFSIHDRFIYLPFPDNHKIINQLYIIRKPQVKILLSPFTIS